MFLYIKKSERIKAYFPSRQQTLETLLVCFNTHIRKSVRWLRSSVRQNVGLQNQMSEVQILSGSPKNLGCWYSWEHSGFASLSPRFEPGTVHQIGEVGKLVTPVDCKSAARKALLVRLQSSPPITVDVVSCQLYNSMKERGPDGKARDC